jgi:hypothetical protein
MKKSLLLLLIFTCGCDYLVEKENKNVVNNSSIVFTNGFGNSYKYETISIDGCEYFIIIMGNSSLHALTHKGNCTNSIHPYTDNQ